MYRQVVVCILTRALRALVEIPALYGQKVRLYMSEKMKQFEFKEGEWVVTGWAEGQMETEREDDRGNKVTVMQPYYQLFVLSPCSSFKSENYGASGRSADAPPMPCGRIFTRWMWSTCTLTRRNGSLWPSLPEGLFSWTKSLSKSFHIPLLSSQRAGGSLPPA